MSLYLHREKIETMMEENFVNYASFTVGENLLYFQVNHNSKFRILLDKDTSYHILYYGQDIERAISVFNECVKENHFHELHFK